MGDRGRRPTRVGPWVQGNAKRIDTVWASSSAGLVVGAWLRAVRLGHGRTLQQVAGPLRVSMATVSRAERGHGVPCADHVSHIARLDHGTWDVGAAEAVAVVGELLRSTAPPYDPEVCVDGLPGWRRRLAHVWSAACAELAVSAYDFPPHLHTPGYREQLTAQRCPHAAPAASASASVPTRDTSTPVRTVLDEAVLLRAQVPADVMAEQVAHIASLIHGGAHIGVLPLACRAPAPWGDHCVGTVRGQALAVALTPVNAIYLTGTAAQHQAAVAHAAAGHAVDRADTLARLEAARLAHAVRAGGDDRAWPVPGPACAPCARDQRR